MSGRVSSAVRRLSTTLRRPWGGVRGLDQPPVVRGWVPFLGCALPFGRDAPQFLRRCQLRHGDAFSVFLMGRRMTFLLDPRDYPTVLKNSETLQFDPIAREISTRAFGYESVYRSGISEDDLRAGYYRHLRPGVMGPLADRTQQALEKALAQRLEALPRRPDGWCEVSLNTLVAEAVFEAGITALFGDGFCDSALREQFQRYDGQFARLVAGVPVRLLGTTRDDRDAMVRRLLTLWPETSEFIRERQVLLEAHVDRSEVARVQLSMLWASQANTIPGAFWALAFLLEDSAALSVIREEVDGIVERQDDGTIRFGAEHLKRMRHLDSAVHEALRLCSGATTIRAVMEPVTLELCSGARCALREGDYACMYPYLSHRDPEIFEEPERYRFDRFYIERGTRQFYKGGERLGFALMPFGGGQTMCPGRFLALSEIKMLVAMLLSAYEFERTPGQQRPAFDLSRSGLGILPPIGSLQIRLRPRSPA